MQNFVTCVEPNGGRVGVSPGSSRIRNVHAIMFNRSQGQRQGHHIGSYIDIDSLPRSLGGVAMELGHSAEDILMGRCGRYLKAFGGFVIFDLNRPVA